MIPISVNPSALSIAVAGRGELALRRFQALRAGGATRILLFSDQPDAVLAQAAAGNLRRVLPDRAALAELRLLWIVGLPEDRAAELAAMARQERVLLNVEDRPGLCDFHSVAEVRRGDLLLTVSTGGASPGLAARIRAKLADQFGPEWGERVAHLRRQRATWREQHHQPAELAAETNALLQANGWLA